MSAPSGHIRGPSHISAAIFSRPYQLSVFRNASVVGYSARVFHLPVAVRSGRSNAPLEQLGFPLCAAHVMR